MSLAFFPMSIGFMSHVDFKKRPCRPVEFKGQGPSSCTPCTGGCQVLSGAQSTGEIGRPRLPQAGWYVLDLGVIYGAQ